jgi:hypothetical protein
MSLDAAGQFVLGFLNDADATAQADAAYLSAVADIAQQQGNDVSSDDIREALRAIAGLDAEVTGFADRPPMTITGTTIDGNTANMGANTAGLGADLVANTANVPLTDFSFSPLGFMR